MANYLSYLMGAPNISDKELVESGVEIKGTTDSGSRMLLFSDSSLATYAALIKEKMDNGFWNEIVGEKEILFIFKFNDGAIKEYKLTVANEKEIDELCSTFNNEPPGKTHNVYLYISENDYYHDFMLEHYGELIARG